MSITGYEMLTVSGDNITADLLVWRRYRRAAPGILEAMLDANPHLATIHCNGPFIPTGVQVRIPIDPDILKGSPQVRNTVTLWSQNPNL